MMIAKIDPAVTAGTVTVFWGPPLLAPASVVTIFMREAWTPARGGDAMEVIEISDDAASAGVWTGEAQRRVVAPAATLAGVAAQLAAGLRFEFSPELVKLARRVGAPRRLAGHEIDQLAARLAHEAADILD